MLRYTLEQILRFVLLLAAVSIVVFALVAASPVDPLQANVGQAALAGMTEEKRAALAQYWSGDANILQRYLGWASALIQGDMGTSLRYNAPVADIIASRALNSLALMAIAWVLSGVIGFTLGMLAGATRGSMLDRAVKAYCFVLAASPTFWVALLLLTVFSVMLGWFPIGFSAPIGVASGQATFADALHHMALPAITLSIVGVANVALHTREKTVDVMASDYMRYAIARGCTKRQALLAHGLRNLVLPAITIQFAQIAEIFGGSVLVEQVFSYPGLGQAAVTAGLGGDVALLAGIAVISAVLVFSGNLVANILYGLVDPRMRLRGRRQAGRRGAPGIAHSNGEGGARG